MDQPITTDAIAEAGVVGAGGAGFPTHVKLAGNADSVLLNAAECEPLLHKDKEVLRAFPHEVLRGVTAAMGLVGARDGYIGVKEKYREVIDAIEPMLPENVKLVSLRDAYPAGDEFILVYDVLGRIIPPGGIPLNVGAVVLNVETALNVALGEPVTTKFLTVAGAVADPVTVRVPVGVTFGEVIGLAGGATVPDPAILVGGVMMGRLAGGPDEVVTKTTGGLIVLPGEHRLVGWYRRSWDAVRRIGASACDQCSFCTELCPRYLLGHPIEPHKAMRSLEFSMVGEANVIGTLYCCECNLCSMYACPEDLDPKEVCTRNKRRLIEQGRKWKVAAEPNRAGIHMNNRRAPLGRLIRKLGLSGFVNKGPLVDRQPDAARVRLPLKQHVGAAAKPTVRVGDTVQAGQPVARPPADKLGAVIHASISGRVTCVSGEIAIERREG